MWHFRILTRLYKKSDSNQKLYHEIIGWKHVSHSNVLPFLGVSETFQFPLNIISPWLPNGNILEYTQKNREADRFQLVGDRHDLYRQTV